VYIEKKECVCLVEKTLDDVYIDNAINFSVGEKEFSVYDFYRVVRKKTKVYLSQDAQIRMILARELVESYVNQGKIEYGISTGFGKFSDVVIKKEEAITLQRNLIISHACGVGEEFDTEIVRGMMFLRAEALAKGNSGVRPIVVELLLEMLNREVYPVIYQKGSLGASGDLVPLAHMTLVMIGEGEAWYNGKKLPGCEALKMAGLEPIILTEKEGLALINGTQAMTSIGALAVSDSKNIIKCADIISAITFEALQGIPDVFSPEVHQIRPHKGQKSTASNMLRLLEGSKLVSRKQQIRVQDAYTLRCIPQIHGASKDALDYVSNVIEIELNSVTDNPLIFPDTGKIISAGNFHGQPVAIAMDFLCIAISELANVSERRIERLVNYQLNDLPPFLTKNGGLNSGFMIPQYVAASLVSENKHLSHPASVDSIPSSANQEDHVSMGTIAARKARSVIKNTVDVLAIEYLTSCQAMEFRHSESAGRATKAAYKLLRKHISPLGDDRIMYKDMAVARELIESGELLKEVEKITGELD
jgi:histidine ammonia-lyase